MSFIPDTKAQDSGFHKKNFARFRILGAKLIQIPESLTCGQHDGGGSRGGAGGATPPPLPPAVIFMTGKETGVKR